MSNGREKTFSDTYTTHNYGRQERAVSYDVGISSIVRNIQEEIQPTIDAIR